MRIFIFWMIIALSFGGSAVQAASSVGTSSGSRPQVCLRHAELLVQRDKALAPYQGHRDPRVTILLPGWWVPLEGSEPPRDRRDRRITAPTAGFRP